MHNGKLGCARAPGLAAIVVHSGHSGVETPVGCGGCSPAL